MTRAIIWPIDIFTCLLAIILIPDIYGKTMPQKSQERLPFAGFSEISPTQDYFILVGDTQSTSHWEFWRERNDKERKLVVDEIVRRGPAFVIHLGDLTTGGSSEEHWQEFDKLHKEVREKRIPYFPILGNHEFFGNDTKAIDYYFMRFPHLERRRWYSFIWKNIGFIMADSNFSTLTGEQSELQAKWYLSELEKFDNRNDIHYIIVGCHEPPFTNSRVVSPNKKSKTYFAEPFIRSRKATFFFSGHAHTYERFESGGKFFVVSGGGGGPRHKVIVNSKKQPYKDLFPGPELRFFHFCEIEVENKRLVFKVVRLEKDGTFTDVETLVIPSEEGATGA